MALPRPDCAPAAALGGVAAFAHAGPALSWHSPAVGRLFGVADSTADRAGVAITFDDGPHAEATPAVLEALREHDAPATFFLVGEQVRRRPALAAEVAAAGHEIGLHCDRHRNLLRLAPRQVREDVLRAEDAIVAATGRVPRLYRAPYGVFTGASLVLARRRAWTPLLWARWGHDWRAAATAESVASELTADLRGGEVLLLHDADHYADPGCWRATAAALPRVIARLRERGLRPVAVGEPASSPPRLRR